MREALNAILFVLSTDCRWQALPKDLPPRRTAHDDLMLRDGAGAVRVHDGLCVVARKTYRIRDEAKISAFDGIERFNNSRRRHANPGNLGPAEFEMKTALA